MTFSRPAASGVEAILIHDFAGAIGGAIVDRDDFVVVVIELQQLRERRPDVFFLIASGNDDADAGIAGRGFRFHSGREMSATFGMPRAASTRRENQTRPECRLRSSET